MIGDVMMKEEKITSVVLISFGVEEVAASGVTSSPKLEKLRPVEV